MCGIAGFWDSSGSLNQELMTRRVGRMTNALLHRGPDAGGVWLDAAAGVALGHRRLSILDLSADGSQPMRSRCGRYTISFNGEIYNYKTLRQELGDYRFRGTSDTEVMLAAIAEWGVDRALDRFNGMFAFALWDAAARQLHLARDRAGEKPLYYGRLQRAIVFGSELKALRAHPDFDARIDRDALALYVRHSYIPAPHTVYEGVHKLPAGAILTLSANDSASLPEPRYYWRLRDAAKRGMVNTLTGSAEDAASELDLRLREAVKLRMEADVPLGAFLSGGVDSSTIVALMQAQSSRRVRTFTVGFNKDSYNEAEQAEAVARRLGTEHTELYVTPADAMAVIPRLGAIYDEPFADSSQIPTILVSELARRHVTVSLSGDGGDELFGGYTRYLWTEDIWRKTQLVPDAIKTAVARTITGLSVQQWETAFERLKYVTPRRMRQRNLGEKLHKLAETLQAGSAAGMYLGLVSQWKDPASVVLGSHEPSTVLSDPSRDFACEDFVHLMMYADTAAYLPDDLLVKIDRASMSVSLEARAPLLDHNLIEFAWRIPQPLKIRDGRGKWLLRRVLDKYVPKSLTERPKMGFDVPINDWLRGPLRGWAEELIGEKRLRSEGFFDPLPIRAKWDEHVAGSRNWQDSIWNILMFQSWLDETRSHRAEPIDDVVSAVGN